MSIFPRLAGFLWVQHPIPPGLHRLSHFCSSALETHLHLQKCGLHTSGGKFQDGLDPWEMEVILSAFCKILSKSWIRYSEHWPPHRHMLLVLVFHLHFLIRPSLLCARCTFPNKFHANVCHKLCFGGTLEYNQCAEVVSLMALHILVHWFICLLIEEDRWQEIKLNLLREKKTD
jgi:hypothetical protein